MTAVGYVGGDPRKLDVDGYVQGDLVAANAAGVLVPVSIGVATQVLTTDNTEPTKVDWEFAGGGGGGATTVLVETAAPAPIADALTLYAYDLGGQTTFRVMTPSGIPATVLRDQIFVARNVTGATINRGTPVYLSGVFPGIENIPEVAPARANAAATMPCIGLAAENLLNNGFGYVMLIGRINDINTVAFAVNQLLYVSASAAGTLTNVKPAHPNFQQHVALVLRSHATLGSIAVLAGDAAGDDIGTIANDFRIGDAAAGTKSLTFVNANTLALQANPTAGRTVTIPDLTGTLAVTQPAAVALTDAATIAVDASLGTQFTVTLGGNRTLGNPTNPPAAGRTQMILFAVRQDGTGSRTLALDTAYRLGTDITAVTLTTTANKTDYIGCRWNATDSKWDVIAFVKGF